MSDNTGSYIMSGEPAHVYSPESVIARERYDLLDRLHVQVRAHDWNAIIAALPNEGLGLIPHILKMIESLDSECQE